MSLWIELAIKQIDGFQRDWWIRTSQHKKPMTEKTEIITYSDPSLDDCKVKMEIISSPINHRGEWRDDIKRAAELINIISDNDEKILNPNDWNISQQEDLDRIGPVSFSCMPFGHFLSFWRLPLEPRYIDMEFATNGMAMINFRYMDPNYMHLDACTIYLKWKGLFDDLLQQHDQKILPWIKTHCKGRLFLFSDFDTIFENAEDEFRFITDFM